MRPYPPYVEMGVTCPHFPLHTMPSHKKHQIKVCEMNNRCLKYIVMLDYMNNKSYHISF